METVVKITPEAESAIKGLRQKDLISKFIQILDELPPNISGQLALAVMLDPAVMLGFALCYILVDYELNKKDVDELEYIYKLKGDPDAGPCD